MTNQRSITVIIFLLFGTFCFAQSTFIDQFNKLGTKPTSVEVVNKLELNSKGGHLQGIQIKRFGLGEYAVVTGSSNTYSYYAVVRLGQANEAISVNKILDKPYKHAGGFQIAGDWLAMGIEDNDTKNSSKIFVCRLGNFEEAPLKPLLVIDRDGEEKRVTAGCVAIAEKTAGLLLIVGDWDAKNLDFYLINDKLKAELVYSLNTEKMSREGWSDQEWLAYQNINLVNDKGQYYLVGLGSKGDEDIADVYQLNIMDWKEFSLTKVATKNFGNNENTKFRWGAGVDINDEGKLRLVSCGANLKNGASFQIFE